jgi:hypothetical protein
MQEGAAGGQANRYWGHDRSGENFNRAMYWLHYLSRAAGRARQRVILVGTAYDTIQGHEPSVRCFNEFVDQLYREKPPNVMIDDGKRVWW